MLGGYVCYMLFAPFALSRKRTHIPYLQVYVLSSYLSCLKVALVWSIWQLAGGLTAADPSTMHLMDVTSGSCLQTGVADATGGLTLQPQCNIPSDSKVCLLPLSHAPCAFQGLQRNPPLQLST